MSDHINRTSLGANPAANMKRHMLIRVFAVILIFIFGIFQMGAKHSSCQYSNVNNDYFNPDKNVSLRQDDSKQGKISTEIKKGFIGFNNTKGVVARDWRILLVNRDNPIPKGFSVELAKVQGNVRFDARAAEHFNSLLKACREEIGYSLQPRTAFRSNGLQKTLYDNKLKSHMNRGKSRNEAERLTNNYIALPGTSEHEIGLAVDFNVLKQEFEETEGFKWLDANAHKYGFILRYPKDKESITKVKYEPWHFRYVGRTHAETMKGKNLCLEEYVHYLWKKSRVNSNSDQKQVLPE